MQVNFSRHALERMSERGVAPWEIRATIQRPDRLDYKEAKNVAMKIRSNGYLLLAVYTTVEKEHNIITVINTSKIKKYLKL